MPKETYTYKHMLGVEPNELEETLNKHGKEGWRAIWVNDYLSYSTAESSGEPYYEIILEKKEERER